MRENPRRASKRWDVPVICQGPMLGLTVCHSKAQAIRQRQIQRVHAYQPVLRTPNEGSTTDAPQRMSIRLTFRLLVMS